MCKNTCILGSSDINFREWQKDTYKEKAKVTAVWQKSPKVLPKENLLVLLKLMITARARYSEKLQYGKCKNQVIS